MRLCTSCSACSMKLAVGQTVGQGEQEFYSRAWGAWAQACTGGGAAVLLSCWREDPDLSHTPYCPAPAHPDSTAQALLMPHQPPGRGISRGVRDMPRQEKAQPCAQDESC